MWCLSPNDREKLYTVLILRLKKYNISEAEALPALPDVENNLRLLNLFLVSKKVQGHSDNTIDTYRRQISFFIQEVNKSLLEVSTNDIRYWLALRETRDKVSSRTLNVDLNALKSFYGFLEDEEILAKNPARKIPTIKFSHKKLTAFTDEEIEKLRAACKNERERCLIEVLLSTGCRVSEALSIKTKDILKDTIEILGKGKKYRKVYLNSSAVEAIDKYLETRQDQNPYLFPSITSNSRKDTAALTSRGATGILKTISKRAGVEDCYPHKFRRTFATKALRNGMSLEKVSLLLGHSSTEVTQRYLDIREEELHEAHKKFVV